MEVSMFCQELDSTPVYDLPSGYWMRAYESGDTQHWIDLHMGLFPDGHISEKLFWHDFGQDEPIITERQFYMMHNERVMGSISAWYGDAERGEHLGRIHWVVLHQDYRGKGLSKPLLSFACERLKQLGHTQAYLITHTNLIPAISLYLQFGFQPEINGEQDKFAWDKVRKHL